MVRVGSINWEEEEQRTAPGASCGEKGRNSKRPQIAIATAVFSQPWRSMETLGNVNRIKMVLNLFLDDYVAPNE